MSRLALAALAAFAAATPAAAQMRCGPAEAIRGRLAADHGEARVFAGLAGAVLIELWLAPSGTWTVLIVRADGAACLAAAGQAGALVPSPPAGTDG